MCYLLNADLAAGHLYLDEAAALFGREQELFSIGEFDHLVGGDVAILRDIPTNQMVGSRPSGWRWSW